VDAHEGRGQEHAGMSAGVGAFREIDDLDVVAERVRAIARPADRLQRSLGPGTGSGHVQAEQSSVPLHGVLRRVHTMPLTPENVVELRLEGVIGALKGGCATDKLSWDRPLEQPTGSPRARRIRIAVGDLWGVAAENG
jgi:hypothetical protein